MTIINNLINDFIHEYEVLSDALFINYSAVISEHFHHSINELHYERLGAIVSSGRHKVESKFLGKEIVETIDTHGGWWITIIPKIDFSVEDFAGFSSKVLPEIS